MKYLFFLFFPFLMVDNTSYKVKTSAITFEIKNAGATVHGSFAGLIADIKFNSLKPTEASFMASVDSKTIETGIDLRNKHLRKPEYFDVDKYPKITLQSTKIEKTGPITYTGTFKLTLKDVTKEITMPFEFIKIPEKTEFKGKFTINRKDYNVGGNSITMSDEVAISVVVDVAE